MTADDTKQPPLDEEASFTGADETSDASISAEDFTEYGDGDYEADYDAEGEEWDAYDEDFAQSSDDMSAPINEGAAPKKNNKRFNQMVIGGAVALGVIVILMQMGGGDAPQQQAPAPAQEQAATQAEQNIAAQEAALPEMPPAPAAPTSQRDIMYGRDNPAAPAAPQSAETTPPTGMFDNPAVLDEVGRNKMEPGRLTPEVVEDPAAAPAPAPQETQTALPVPVVPQETQPAPAVLPETAPAETLAETPAAPAPQEVMTTTPAVSVPVADVETLNGKLDALFERLDSVEDQIQSAPAADPALAQEVKALGQTVRALEQRVEDVAAKTERSVSGADVVVPVKKAAPQKAKAAPKPRAKTASTSGSLGTLNAAPAWVLRAAQPGQALIARPDGGGMQTVQPGTMLPGIGRVTSIYNQDGRWVVQGTSGRITQ